MKLINNVEKPPTAKIGHVVDFEPGDVLELNQIEGTSPYVLLRLADNQAVVLVGYDSVKAVPQSVKNFASNYKKVDANLVINR